MASTAEAGAGLAWHHRLDLPNATPRLHEQQCDAVDDGLVDAHEHDLCKEKFLKGALLRCWPSGKGGSCKHEMKVECAEFLRSISIHELKHKSASGQRANDGRFPCCCCNRPRWHPWNVRVVEYECEAIGTRHTDLRLHIDDTERSLQERCGGKNCDDLGVERENYAPLGFLATAVRARHEAINV